MSLRYEEINRNTFGKKSQPENNYHTNQMPEIVYLDKVVKEKVIVESHFVIKVVDSFNSIAKALLFIALSLTVCCSVIAGGIIVFKIAMRF